MFYSNFQVKMQFILHTKVYLVDSVQLAALAAAFGPASHAAPLQECRKLTSILLLSPFV